ALAAHDESLTRVKALVEQANTNNDFQHFLGQALTEQGQTLARLPDRRPQAEGNFSEAILIWEELQNRSPSYPMYAEWQAVASEARGRLRTALGRLGPAEDDLDKSRRLQERLVNESPGLPSYRGQLGRTY